MAVPHPPSSTETCLGTPGPLALLKGLMMQGHRLGCPLQIIVSVMGSLEDLGLVEEQGALHLSLSFLPILCLSVQMTSKEMINTKGPSAPTSHWMDFPIIHQLCGLRQAMSPASTSLMGASTGIESSRDVWKGLDVPGPQKGYSPCWFLSCWDSQELSLSIPGPWSWSLHPELLLTSPHGRKNPWLRVYWRTQGCQFCFCIPFTTEPQAAPSSLSLVWEP